MRISVAGALVVSAIALLPVPAEAQRGNYKSRDYVSCDGYSKPNQRSDRLHAPESTAQGGVRYRSIVGHGRAGLEACDRVLTDPRVTQIHRVREMNLLVSKALHLSKLRRFDEALAALDQANAVPVEDNSGIIAESIGMRGQFARAYIYSETGDVPAAVAILDGLAQQRQYSPGISMAAIDFARSLDKDWAR